MKDKEEESFECAITSRVLYGPEVLQMRIIGWRKTIVTNDTTSMYLVYRTVSQFHCSPYKKDTSH